VAPLSYPQHAHVGVGGDGERGKGHFELGEHLLGGALQRWRLVDEPHPRFGVGFAPAPVRDAAWERRRADPRELQNSYRSHILCYYDYCQRSKFKSVRKKSKSFWI
jgi:hypothetical protein